MLGVVQFGDYHEMFGAMHGADVRLQEYVWRNRTIVAAYRLHPSGRELIGVLRTSYKVYQRGLKR